MPQNVTFIAHAHLKRAIRTTAYMGIVLGILQWSIVIRTIPWKTASAPEQNWHLEAHLTMKNDHPHRGTWLSWACAP